MISKATKKIIIVMPAYNAGRKIESVFARIPKDFIKKVSEFVIVNDGSADDTAEKIESLKKKHKVKALTHDRNRGYGSAWKTGFSQAVQDGADIAVLLHSDGQYPPEMLPAIVSPIQLGFADMVLGSRIMGRQALKGGMPLKRYLGNRVLTVLENLAYGLNISEYHTGYVAYSKRALTEIPFIRLSDTFHIDGEMILMASKRKMRIWEIPIPTYYGDEKSYVNSFTYGLDVLKTILRNFLGKYNF